MPDQRAPTLRLAALRALADSQCGVVTRTQLYASGVSRGEVRAQIRACRWQRLGAHCLALHTGPIEPATRAWVAVLEAGPRAFLDGEAALIAAGLEHYTTDRLRVSVPRGARIRHRATGYDIRQTRRWSAQDVLREPGHPPRAKPAVAAIHAALWARSDRQAALLLTMTVQQHLATAADLAEQLLRVRRDRRRGHLATVILDLAGGVRSLSELDVVRGCRDRHLAPPDLQVLRRTPQGSYYLDMRWHAWRVVVEVDGIQHQWAENLVADAVRHNAIAIEGDTVLRLPILGLRLAPGTFFGQIRIALRANGWRDDAAA